MNIPPDLQPATRIGFFQLCDSTLLCLFHGGLLHHVVHADFLQRSFFKSEYAVEFSEDVPVLLRESIK